MLYADKKALDYSSVSAPIAEAQNNQELISISNITQYFESSKVLIRNSLITPEMDADYMDAVNNGDMETAQQMVILDCIKAKRILRMCPSSSTFPNLILCDSPSRFNIM